MRLWVMGDFGEGTAGALAVRDAYYGYTGATHTDLWLMLGDNAMPRGTDHEYQIRLFDVYDEIRRVNRAESVYAPWEAGDLAIVDNMLCLHGRNHYTGERKILITLS